MKKKDIVIIYFDEDSLEIIKNAKNTTIYVWKHAKENDELIKYAETNNLTIVYFEDTRNYLNKKLWAIKDESGSYWTGKYAQHPFGGRARLFLKYLSYAKKYFSEKSAIRAAETMKNNGVFKPSNKYIIERAN
jgi:hypothetical protein